MGTLGGPGRERGLYRVAVDVIASWQQVMAWSNRLHIERSEVKTSSK